MKSLVLCILVCGLFTVSLAASSTPYFKEVFMGKCFNKNPTGVDCYALYGNFSNAAMTYNYDVTDALWDPFFAIANFSTPESSIMFWSGNKDFALAITSNDARFVTVEETSTGYIINGMSWCGTLNHTFDEVNPCEFANNPTKRTKYYGLQGVWNRASLQFARGAKGSIYVLLQPGLLYGTNDTFVIIFEASRYYAYRNSSIFGSIELPNINPAQVSNITILLLKNSSVAPTELCGTGSLLVLSNVIRKQFGFSPTCVDDPVVIYNLLCPRGTTSGECLAATLVYHEEVVNKKTTQDNLGWAISVTVIAAVLFLVVLALAGYIVFSRRGYEAIRGNVN